MKACIFQTIDWSALKARSGAEPFAASNIPAKAVVKAASQRGSAIAAAIGHRTGRTARVAAGKLRFIALQTIQCHLASKVSQIAKLVGFIVRLGCQKGNSEAEPEMVVRTALFVVFRQIKRFQDSPE